MHPKMGKNGKFSNFYPLIPNFFSDIVAPYNRKVNIPFGTAQGPMPFYPVFTQGGR